VALDGAKDVIGVFADLAVEYALLGRAADVAKTGLNDVDLGGGGGGVGELGGVELDRGELDALADEPA